MRSAGWLCFCCLAADFLPWPRVMCASLVPTPSSGPRSLPGARPTQQQHRSARCVVLPVGQGATRAACVGQHTGLQTTCPQMLWCNRWSSGNKAPSSAGCSPTCSVHHASPNAFTPNVGRARSSRRQCWPKQLLGLGVEVPSSFTPWPRFCGLVTYGCQWALCFFPGTPNQAELQTQTPKPTPVGRRLAVSATNLFSERERECMCEKKKKDPSRQATSNTTASQRVWSSPQAGATLCSWHHSASRCFVGTKAKGQVGANHALCVQRVKFRVEGVWKIVAPVTNNTLAQVWLGALARSARLPGLWLANSMALHKTKAGQLGNHFEVLLGNVTKPCKLGYFADLSTRVVLEFFVCQKQDVVRFLACPVPVEYVVKPVAARHLSGHKFVQKVWKRSIVRYCRLFCFCVMVKGHGHIFWISCTVNVLAGLFGVVGARHELVGGV
eukprot:m.412574 g.412574  ORF g.412574 m.412574 type:complete len:440 (+) comp20170_c2_seq9:1679-2998(+)